MRRKPENRSGQVGHFQRGNSLAVWWGGTACEEKGSDSLTWLLPFVLETTRGDKVYSVSCLVAHTDANDPKTRKMPEPVGTSVRLYVRG
jgi:hypothetical protein